MCTMRYVIMIPVVAAGHICRSHHWQIPKKQNKKFLQAKYEELAICGRGARNVEFV
jgi:hypothetical protein